MNDNDMWNKVCKEEFKWIRDQLTNHIPTLIRQQFWKFLGISLTVVGIVIAILKLVG